MPARPTVRRTRAPVEVVILAGVEHVEAGRPQQHDEREQERHGAVERAAHGDPRARRLWFDVASCVDLNISTANAALVAKRIRQIGVKRILYGSDAAVGDNLRPRESWAAFRRLPLTEAEFKQIARNVAPYLR